MPQIGWFEILIIVVLAILIVGPKDFPIILKKVGNWISHVKRYFGEIQKNVTDIEDDIKEEISVEENFDKEVKKNIKKNER